MSREQRDNRESPYGQNRPNESQYPLPPQQGSYPPPPQQQGYPAPGPYSAQGTPNQQGDMMSLPPPPMQQQDLYRTHHMQGHPQDMYSQYAGPLQYPPQQQGVGFGQPAPRQRTAIACRYCRRRKVRTTPRVYVSPTNVRQIRCHGFDQNPEGRCTNCTRFNQECIFSPVSSQAAAFVPAHTAYPHLRNPGRMSQGVDGRSMYPQQGGPMIYGAHGQPLGPIPPHDPHYPPPQQYGAAPYPSPGYDGRGHPQTPMDDQVSCQPRVQR